MPADEIWQEQKSTDGLEAASDGKTVAGSRRRVYFHKYVGKDGNKDPRLAVCEKMETLTVARWCYFG